MVKYGGYRRGFCSKVTKVCSWRDLVGFSSARLRQWLSGGNAVSNVGVRRVIVLSAQEIAGWLRWATFRACRPTPAPSLL